MNIAFLPMLFWFIQMCEIWFYIHTVGKTGTKKKFWILDFTGFCCPSEFSGL